ncbi:uncharacterized protein F5891DRAFT_1201138 [Suillus fuscotomentosus]|uniref:Uncharacterized protein n=1 Tax=Suillus fuscotomentosus TaxID=1912939 RepID=A0AAD4DNM0_9AGAM|nr:uncharacterized protein F5891DRAFT_1201138 [Suillus fuscotomentosus]KAG1886356.1 hypothetical protein F5891DRAFT_1201138 [Suillus fuscotomentosus]
MVKSKNDTAEDREGSTHAWPNKKIRLSNTGASNEIPEGTEIGEGGGDPTGEAQHAEATDDDQHRSKQDSIGTVATANPTPSDAISPTTVGKRGGGATQPTLSVRTVIPNPTKLLIDEAEVKDYGNELKARLHKLSNYTNEKAHVYALGRLLLTATWGQYKAVNDRSKTLCDPATGEPLTIWVVGHITHMWFAKRGVPESQASITILPLAQNLARQSAHLLAKFSSPVLAVNQQTTHNIRAIKWQNARNDDIQTEAILFDSVYDARGEGSLKTYDERPLWSLGDLKAGDLVLLEMKMTRYSRRGEDNKWQSRAQYEMLAISLLNIGPAPEAEAEGMSKIDGLAI